MKAACLQYLDWAVTDKPKLSFAFGKGLFSDSGCSLGVKVLAAVPPFPSPQICVIYFFLSVILFAANESHEKRNCRSL